MINNFWRAAIVLALALLVAGCALPRTEPAIPERPALLVHTGQTVTVKLLAWRSSAPQVTYPQSEYTRGRTESLGQDYANFDDPSWWARLQKKVQADYLAERQPGAKGNINFYRVLDVGWLKENVRRDYLASYHAEFVLPFEGEFQRAISNSEFLQLPRRFGIDSRDPRATAFWISLNNDDLFSSRRTGNDFSMQAANGSFRYSDNLTKLYWYGSYLEIADQATILFRFTDHKRYLVFDLPAEYRHLSKSDLDRTGSFTFNLSPEILGVTN